MNKVLFICILMIGYSSSQAQQAIESSEVPSAVTAALKNNYPNANDITWETQDGMYQASFTYKKTEMAVVYSDKGVLGLTETQIEVASLPEGVREYFAKNAINGEITDASRIVNSQNSVIYEVEVNDEDYLFNADGKFVRKIRNP